MSTFIDMNILVTLDNGEVQGVKAKVIAGSGLAYVEQKDGLYCIVQIASGLYLLKDIPYEGKVQRVMLAIAGLYDWTKPLQPMRDMDIPPELYQIYLRMQEIRQEVIYGGK